MFCRYWYIILSVKKLSNQYISYFICIILTNALIFVLIWEKPRRITNLAKLNVFMKLQFQFFYEKQGDKEKKTLFYFFYYWSNNTICLFKAVLLLYNVCQVVISLVFQTIMFVDNLLSNPSRDVGNDNSSPAVRESENTDICYELFHRKIVWL